MKTIKVIETTKIQLGWLVAKCEGATNLRFDTVACWWFTLNGKDRVLSRGWSTEQNYAPATDWAHGGPIIERENIALYPHGDGTYEAEVFLNPKRCVGPTPLVAAMRCYVISKLGDEVETPKELL